MKYNQSLMIRVSHLLHVAGLLLMLLLTTTVTVKMTFTEAFLPGQVKVVHPIKVNSKSLFLLPSSSSSWSSYFESIETTQVPYRALRTISTRRGAVSSFITRNNYYSSSTQHNNKNQNRYNKHWRIQMTANQDDNPNDMSVHSNDVYINGSKTVLLVEEEEAEAEVPEEKELIEKEEIMITTRTGEQDEISTDNLLQDATMSSSSLSSSAATTTTSPFKEEEFLNMTKVNSSSSEYFEPSPQLTFSKFLTMQDKRVPILFRYSNEAGLRPYFLTAAKKIKDENPDVIISKRIIPQPEHTKDEDLIFEILVDDKVVIGKPQCKWQGVTRKKDNGSSNGGNESSSNGSGGDMNVSMDLETNRVFGLSVYISMNDVNDAIAKARRKRRPNTAYAQEGGRKVGLGFLSE